ncbi:glycosyltransferase family 4 protein [Lutimonas saemankumensis]|uniref:glycosyltransferase family 4 protein n=1 Tax=Lutimonas saemankumensis TaxID=483016 RepID=UPI001CD60442|nr:glycosyltransferase family 4 protein [Lutimonas saemankumensis]MCA0933792.1 glycosyltransferase family 4 protein [Lutimonas saemankumensis]
MILDKPFPPDPRVENEALALIDSGYEVYLFCLSYQKEAESESYKGIQIKRYSSSRMEYKFSALSYTLPFYRMSLSKKIRNFLEVNEIGVIHIHDMVAGEAVLSANTGLNLPVILDLHENRPEIMKYYPHLNKFPGNLLISPGKWRKKEGELVKKVTKTIVVTDESKKELTERLGISSDRVAVVPNTVKEGFYQDYVLDGSIVKRYEGKFVILYLGDTGLRRGLLSVIEAVANIVHGQHLKQKLKLVIVGSNSTDQILKNKVEELGIQEYVDFEGWQEPNTFQSYLKVARIGVSPLHRNLHHDTTYANKLFQYMSFGVPVVASDAKAQKHLVERAKSGLIHKEKDIKDLEEKIRQLLKNDDLASELGSNGQKFIKNKFSWEMVSSELKNLYLEFESS